MDPTNPFSDPFFITILAAMALVLICVGIAALYFTHFLPYPVVLGKVHDDLTRAISDIDTVLFAAKYGAGWDDTCTDILSQARKRLHTLSTKVSP